MQGDQSEQSRSGCVGREEQAMVVEQSMKSESDDPKVVKSISPMYLQADPDIEIPHIDFIFGDQKAKVNDCDLVIHILHPIIQGSIQARSIHQRHPSILPIYSLKKSFPMFKSRKENEEQLANQKFIRWIFDH